MCTTPLSVVSMKRNLFVQSFPSNFIAVSFLSLISKRKGMDVQVPFRGSIFLQDLRLRFRVERKIGVFQISVYPGWLECKKNLEKEQNKK